MKKLLLIISLIGSFAWANAQTITQKVAVAGSTTKNMVVAKGGFRSDSTMGFPNRDTTYIPERLGDAVIRPQDHLLYVYLGNWYVFQNSPKNIYASQGLHAINDSTMGMGGHFISDDTISLSGVYSMLYDSTVHWRIRGSNTQALDASTIFEVQSTVRGVLFSKMNTAQMNAISSPTSALMVYNTDSLDYCVYDGTKWTRASSFYVKDGSLYSDRTVSGNGHSLLLGSSGSPTSFTNFYSNSTIGLFGIPTLSAFPSIPDANYVSPANQATFKLPVVTANRTFTPPASGGNKMIYIWSGNNSAFTWSPAAGSVFKDATGTTLASFQGNTFYTFMSDGTNWIQVGAAAGPIIASGPYTPTFTNTSNITTSGLNQAYYQRIGNIVDVTVGGVVTPTVNGNVTLTVTLPIATSLTTQNFVGFGIENMTASWVSGVVNVISSTQAQIQIGATSSGFSQAIVFHFKYSL